MFPKNYKYRPLPEMLTIANSPIEGLGLFATEDLEANMDLGISHVPDNRFENNMIRTPLGGFINHSLTPNSRIVKKSDGCYHIITLRLIKKGEEVFCNYFHADCARQCGF